MKEFAIEANNIHKYYKKFTSQHKFLTFKSAILERSLFKSLHNDEKFEALKGVDLKVEKGKTISIIGGNGSGKSTMLKLLAGISQPTSGQIKTRGRISALIELGAGFHPEISGRENIFINGIILGLSKKQIEEKFDEIVEFAELEDFIENPVKTYSSGMYMRLGFSIAINVDPDILLIDEILSVGDASFVPKCLDRINKFKKEGKTIIFVSHDLATVEKISDEVVWLDKGELKMRSHPKRVVGSYLEYIWKKEADKVKDSNEAPEEEIVNTEKRWGSREVYIKGLEMYDAKGEEKYLFNYDEPVTVVIDVVAKEKQTDFVFGFGIYNTEGVNCYGSNTDLESYKGYEIKGSGKVTINIPALQLVNGTYYFNVAVHKKDGSPYDYHHNRFAFIVSSDYTDIGICRIPHTWQFSENIDIREELL